MPFSTTKSATEDEWNKVYTNLFKPIIERSKFGYECKRSELENGSFTREIVRDLREAHVVFSDLTDFNPNVMWELGVRHSLSKRTIMVARMDFISQIPSDIREYGVIPYEQNITNYTEFEEEIARILEKINNNPEKPDSPVFNFLKEEELTLLSFERKQIINKLTGLLSEVLANELICKRIKSDPESIKENNLTTYRFWTRAIEYLLMTNYVTIESESILVLRNYRLFLEYANDWLKIGHETINGGNPIHEDKLKLILKYINEIEKCIPDIIKILKNELIKVKEGKLTYLEPPIITDVGQEHLLK